MAPLLRVLLQMYVYPAGSTFAPWVALLFSSAIAGLRADQPGIGAAGPTVAAAFVAGNLAIMPWTRMLGQGAPALPVTLAQRRLVTIGLILFFAMTPTVVSALLWIGPSFLQERMLPTRLGEMLLGAGLATLVWAIQEGRARRRFSGRAVASRDASMERLSPFGSPAFRSPAGPDGWRAVRALVGGPGRWRDVLIIAGLSTVLAGLSTTDLPAVGAGGVLDTTPTLRAVVPLIMVWAVLASDLSWARMSAVGLLPIRSWQWGGAWYAEGALRVALGLLIPVGAQAVWFVVSGQSAALSSLGPVLMVTPGSCLFGGGGALLRGSPHRGGLALYMLGAGLTLWMASLTLLEAVPVFRNDAGILLGFAPIASTPAGLLGLGALWSVGAGAMFAWGLRGR